MTANRAHTPSQEMFRLAYKHILDNWLITPEGRQQALGEYDRMIAQVEAAAEQRGAAIVLRDLADSLIAGHDPETDTRIFDPWDVAEMLRHRANKADQHRADQMEGDDVEDRI